MDKFADPARRTRAIPEVPIGSENSRRDGVVFKISGSATSRKNVSLPVSVLFFALVLMLTGCFDPDLGIFGNEICTPGVQFRYSYNEENSATDNRVGLWVEGIDEYIFDNGHLLHSVRRIGKKDFETTLPLESGKYSVIAIGNGDGRSVVTDAATGGEPLIGVTHREDLRLSLQNAEQLSGGTVGPCEELFHGYRTFSVGNRSVSRVKVDMTNAHFQLRFKVRWQDSSVPQAGTYYAVVEDIPSQYALMPEYVFPSGSFEATKHDPDVHDTHPSTSNETIHHIPATVHEDANTLSHSYTSYLNADYEVWGEFVHYRIKNDTPLTLSLYYAPSGTRATDDPSALPHAIDLQECLAYFDYNLDVELKQEYVLDIEINGDQIIINPVEGLGIADWTDGGWL